MLAGIVEGAGFVARAIIGHDANVDNTKAVAISDCGLGKSVKFIAFWSGRYREADAGGILYTDINIFPTDTLALGSTLAVPAESVVYTI